MTDAGSSLLAWLLKRLRIFRIVLIILLVAALAWWVDLRAVVAMFQAIQWQWLTLAFVIVQLQIVLSALRWQFTAVSLGQHLSISIAIREYYLATVANLSLPGGVLGDASRIYRNRHGHGIGAAAQAVVLERAAGQLTLLALCLLTSAIWFYHAPDLGSVAGKLLLLAVAIIVGVFALLWFTWCYASERVVHYISSFGPAVKTAWLSESRWVFQSFLSTLIVFSYVLVFACCTQALGKPLAVGAMLVIVPLVLLSMSLPLSVGGWGLREVTAASLWPMAGFSAEAGVASSVLYALVSLASCLPGLLLIFTHHDTGNY